jgi:hypothetical protein
MRKVIFLVLTLKCVGGNPDEKLPLIQRSALIDKTQVGDVELYQILPSGTVTDNNHAGSKYLKSDVVQSANDRTKDLRGQEKEVRKAKETPLELVAKYPTTCLAREVRCFDSMSGSRKDIVDFIALFLSDIPDKGVISRGVDAIFRALNGPLYRSNIYLSDVVLMLNRINDVMTPMLGKRMWTINPTQGEVSLVDRSEQQKKLMSEYKSLADCSLWFPKIFDDIIERTLLSWGELARKFCNSPKAKEALEVLFAAGDQTKPLSKLYFVYMGINYGRAGLIAYCYLMLPVMEKSDQFLINEMIQLLKQ